MAYHTIEERTALGRQIQELKEGDKIEVTTYYTNIWPGKNFLKISDNPSRVAYFLKADGERITVSDTYDPINLNFLPDFNKRKIRIRKISKLDQLEKKVDSH
jgi:hypothetical protein